MRQKKWSGNSNFLSLPMPYESVRGSLPSYLLPISEGCPPPFLHNPRCLPPLVWLGFPSHLLEVLELSFSYWFLHTSNGKIKSEQLIYHIWPHRSQSLCSLDRSSSCSFVFGTLLWAVGSCLEQVFHVIISLQCLGEDGVSPDSFFLSVPLFFCPLWG